MRLIHKVSLCVLVALSVGLLAGCGSRVEAGTPAAAVQSLLELRSELSTDSARYGSFVETSMATVLAQDAASLIAKKKSPMPAWETPETTEESTTSAKVKVVWKADPKFPDWAESTTFSLSKETGRWMIVDAVSASPSKAATGTP